MSVGICMGFVNTHGKFRVEQVQMTGNYLSGSIFCMGIIIILDNILENFEYITIFFLRL